MPIRIIENITSPNYWIRIKHWIIDLLSNLCLLLAALLAGWWMVSLLKIVNASSVGWKQTIVTIDDVQSVPLPKAAMIEEAVLLGLSIIVLLLLGIQIKQTQKRFILFLRRFGFQEATRSVSYAVDKAIGTRWRVATLDDSAVASLGMEMRSRRRFIYFSLFLFFTTVTSTCFFAYYDNGSTYGVIGALGLALFLATMLLLYSLFFGSFSLFSWIFQRAGKKIDRKRKWDIYLRSDIDPAIRRISTWAKRIFAPRLVVVKVTDDHWQTVVERLGKKASAILVDISVPSEHLIWEISSLRPQTQVPWIFVGARQKVLELMAADQNALSFEARQLKTLLEGEEVIVYQDTNEKASTIFSKDLSIHLETL